MNDLHFIVTGNVGLKDGENGEWGGRGVGEWGGGGGGREGEGGEEGKWEEGKRFVHLRRSVFISI